jgi:hypothetical protein
MYMSYILRVNAQAFINTLGRCIKTRNAKFREVLIEKKHLTWSLAAFIIH